VRKVPTEATR